MLDGRSKWHRQPTQPVEWDERNSLCERLVSLAVLINGQWMECGPHGSCAPFARAGTLTNVYKAPAAYLGGGHRGDALLMATQSTAAGEGYYFDYGFNILAASVDALTAFALGYTNAVSVTAKYIASWGDNLAYAFTVRNGDGAGSNARLFSFLQTGTDSFRGMAANTGGEVDFVSGSKTIAGGAPAGYLNGVVSTGSSANGTGVLSSPVNRITLGNSTSLAPAGTDGGCCLAGAYDRELTAEEHAALAENPWQLLRPRTARIYSFPSPAATPSISGTSDSNTLIDEAGFVVSGSNLAAATAVTFRQTDRPEFDATAYITANTSAAVTLTGLDVQDMSMAYGAATVEVTTAAGTSSAFAITIAPKATQQFINLSGHTPGAGWALGNATLNGDQLVAPLLTAQGATFAFSGTDGTYSITGDPEYTGAGDTAYWAWFDASADQWYETLELSLGSGGGDYPLLRHTQMRQARAGRVVAFSRRGGARR